jgi:DNA-binding LacI/PurR family transcriptional regulator
MWVNQPNTYADARDAARLMLLGPEPPTAVLCLTDVLASAVLAAAADAGLAVPDDLAVVGFDDHPLAVRSRPSLTTVRQDVEAKGRAAAQALLALIAGSADGSLSRPHSRQLAVQLQVRASTRGESS